MATHELCPAAFKPARCSHQASITALSLAHRSELFLMAPCLLALSFPSCSICLSAVSELNSRMHTGKHCSLYCCLSLAPEFYLTRSLHCGLSLALSPQEADPSAHSATPPPLTRLPNDSACSSMPRRHRMRCRQGRGRGHTSRPLCRFIQSPAPRRLKRIMLGFIALAEAEDRVRLLNLLCPFILSPAPHRLKRIMLSFITIVQLTDLISLPQLQLVSRNRLQVQASSSAGRGTRKRPRKPTIATVPPQLSRTTLKETEALLVKLDAHSSSSSGSGSGSPEWSGEDRRKGGASMVRTATTPEPAANHSKQVDDSSEEYRCLIVEEPPPQQHDI